MASLQDVYNKYKGQSVSVDGIPANAGQCVQWADKVLNEVYAQPFHYANAIDWWNNPQELKNNFDFIPYSPSMPVKAGDFVVYGTGVGSPYGHIDVVAQDGVGNNYVGYDSNWGHNLTVHQVNHDDSYNQYILGIIRPKGGGMSDVQAQQIASLVNTVKTYEGRINDLQNNVNSLTQTAHDYEARINALQDEVNQLRAGSGVNKDSVIAYLQGNLS